MSIDTIRKDTLKRLEKSKEVISDLIPKEVCGIKKNNPAIYQGMCTFTSKRNCNGLPSNYNHAMWLERKKNERKGGR